jgi:hypothetical protein
MTVFKHKGWPSRPRLIPAAFWGLTFSALLYVLAGHMADPKWGAGPRNSNFPANAVRVINEVQPPGHIFNFLEMGGYLSWALEGRYQVFIDGRNFQNNRALAAFLSIIRGGFGWQRALKHYDVNTIVIPALYIPYGQLVPIVSILADDPEWQLAATGSREMLFFRDSVAADLPAKYQLDKSQVWMQVINEARLINSRLPRVSDPFLSMGEAYLRLGEDKLAIEAYRAYLRLKPDDQAVAEQLAALEAKQRSIK